jgi:hypothetical protein
MAILSAIKAKHENFSMMYDIACKLPKQIQVSNQGGAAVCKKELVVTFYTGQIR